MKNISKFGLLKKLKSKKLSLSQKIILSMAGMVLLTVAASSILFYFVFNRQVDDFAHHLEKARQISQQNGQPVVSDAEIVNRIKAAVNGDNANPQEVLDKVRGALNVNREVNYLVIKNALQESGWNQGFPQEVFGSKPPSHNPNLINLPNNNQILSGIILNPVADSIWIGVLLAAVMSILLGWLLARGIVKPLRRLEKASEQVAGGNYKLEIKQTGDSDLARLAGSFNRMAKTLSLTEQKRKDLLTDISHEFRTPLSSIQGYTEVLRDGLVVEPERQHEIFDHILNEVKHLTAMVNSMRAWVTNEQTLENVNLSEISVKPLAEEVIKRFQHTANQKNIDLELDLVVPDLKIRSDSDAVMHALSNLVDNALRYTGESGNVKVRVGYEPVGTGFQDKMSKATKGKRVWFEVSDNGIGIAKDHLPFVFERFYRVDKSRSRNTGGTGLGLAIVRDTVQTLGGEVKIESEPGLGTTIGFWLPSVVTERSHRRPLPVFSSARPGI